MKATGWPCPTFTLAAGNFAPGDGKLHINHKGYSTLKVGSHHKEGLAMAASSKYCNPLCAHSDRELPGFPPTAPSLAQMSSSAQASAWPRPPSQASWLTFTRSTCVCGVGGSPRSAAPSSLRARAEPALGREERGSWWGDRSNNKLRNNDNRETTDHILHCVSRRTRPVVSAAADNVRREG